MGARFVSLRDGQFQKLIPDTETVIPWSTNEDHNIIGTWWPLIKARLNRFPAVSPLEYVLEERIAPGLSAGRNLFLSTCSALDPLAERRTAPVCVKSSG